MPVRRAATLSCQHTISVEYLTACEELDESSVLPGYDTLLRSLTTGQVGFKGPTPCLGRKHTEDFQSWLEGVS